MSTPKFDKWLRTFNEKQRNIVFPDTARNLGGFWGGLYRQKLNTIQAVGLLILLVFYIAFFIGIVVWHWPREQAPLWKKVFYGYGPYALLSLPLIFFFLVLRWRMRPSKTIHSRRMNE